MKTLKSLNFGPRGYLLLAYAFISMMSFTVFTNWPMNILADVYGGAQKISLIYTSGAVVAIVIQLIISVFIGKIKSMKKVSIFMGLLSLIFALTIMLIPPTQLVAWKACYFFECLIGPMWCTFSVGVIVGQWFPTKKGTFMGIATLAFPITNGLTGAFASSVFAGGMPNIKGALIPYFVIVVIGWLIGLCFIKDYPEQCGGYRDNDKNMTAEKANAMLVAEVEAKRTTVWKTGACLSNRDFWFATISVGFLLMFSVGTMTQTASIIGSYGAEMDKFGGYVGVMVLVMIFGIVGSMVLGLLDTALGTKKALLISSVIMLLSGACGLVGNATATVVSIILLALFMGASSNFTVSVSAQYWRREDFPSVFAVLSPVATLLSAVGPTVVATAMVTKGTTGVFGIVLAAGVISVILMFAFSPKNVKTVDDKRRAKAGKTLDDALVGRK